MNTKSILIILILSIVTTIACCGPEPVEPVPTIELDQLIDRRVNQWLERRMDQNSFDIFQDGKAEWSNADNTAQLAEWFQVNLGEPSGFPGLWDFASMVEEIRESDLYQRGPPIEEQFTAKIIKVLLSFNYDEELE